MCTKTGRVYTNRSWHGALQWHRKYMFMNICCNAFPATALTFHVAESFRCMRTDLICIYILSRCCWAMMVFLFLLSLVGSRFRSYLRMTIISQRSVYYELKQKHMHLLTHKGTHYVYRETHFNRL